MALQIRCFWNGACCSGLYWIFESSNSLSPSYRIRLLPILICYSQWSSVQSRRTKRPKDEMSWDEQGRNPANNVAASIGIFQKRIKLQCRRSCGATMSNDLWKSSSKHLQKVLTKVTLCSLRRVTVVETCCCPQNFCMQKDCFTLLFSWLLDHVELMKLKITCTWRSVWYKVSRGCIEADFSRAWHRTIGT